MQMSLKRSGPAVKAGIETPISVHAIDRSEEMLWVSRERPVPDTFPPCIKGMLSALAPSEGGRHRTAAILAAFLGQVGYSREEAWQVWSKVAFVEKRIFDEWFLKMHCPKCQALKRKSKGYPDPGLADLGLCHPDEICQSFEGPVEYACRVLSEKDREKGFLTHIKTRYLVRAFNWSTGKEMEIELSEKEKEALEALLAEKADRNDRVIVYVREKVRGRLRPRFRLQEQSEPRRQMLSDMI
jgi:hypothetical protein